MMTRLQKVSPASKKSAASPKAKQVTWSNEKSAALRKAAAFPSGGDCNCNCNCGK